MKKIYLIGIGMGTRESLTQEAKEKIEEAELLIGDRRCLHEFEDSGKRLLAEYKKEVILSTIEEAEEEVIAILFSGDSGFYSGSKGVYFLIKRYMEENRWARNWKLEVIPGISSISYLASKTGISWENAAIVSIHGRNENLFSYLRVVEKVFALIGGNLSELLEDLVEAGYGEMTAYVGQRMGYPEERIFSGKILELLEETFDPLTTVLLLPGEWRKSHPIRERRYGFSDEDFVRGKAPMTKSEVRAVAMSRLAIRENDVVYDIGAGTGSVSVEMAYQASKGVVYAIEKEESALAILEANKQKFHCRNLEIIEGRAKNVMKDLPACDVAFIGGSGGELKDILLQLLEKNPFVHVVITVIALESLGKCLNVLEELSMEEVEISQVQVSRGKKIGPYHLMEGLNPVYVISCDKEKKPGVDLTVAETGHMED